MYQINIKGIDNKYEYEELTKIFLNPSGFEMTTDGADDADLVIDADIITEADEKAKKNAIKRILYENLAEYTGQRPDWGILTGVRPVKLAGELIERYGVSEAKRRLSEDYLLSREKMELITDTYLYQQEVTGHPEDKSLGIYVGIPFCPTRCLYCSFTSNQKGPEEIEKYLKALHEEIEFCGKMQKERGYVPESVYIGGGTPTTLTAGQMDELLTHIEQAFDLSRIKEFTVEAGRPDTITAEKLAVIHSHGVNRISVNPQTMKDETLELIGRAHSTTDTRNAMKTALGSGIPVINMDVITGLPGETPEDFKRTLDELVNVYHAQNITVHTLAVKRASRLIEEDPDYHYKQGQVVREMLKIAKDMLTGAGYKPYYLYRQKHMAGSFENIGWCLPGTEGIYNIRIMEEAQTIAALGAGGISKQYYKDENRLERVANVSNYEIYIERLSEMLERKINNLFINF